jgi:hypothetical protein
MLPCSVKASRPDKLAAEVSLSNKKFIKLITYGSVINTFTHVIEVQATVAAIYMYSCRVKAFRPAKFAAEVSLSHKKFIKLNTYDI